MNLLKVLGGIGLIAGGIILTFMGKKKDYESDPEILDEERQSNNETEDEILDDGRDLNPYNRPDCLVPEEAYADKKGNRRYNEDDYSEPTWVRSAKLCAEGIPNIARGILNTVSDSYQLYGMYRTGQDVDTYIESYNDRYSGHRRYSGNYQRSTDGGYYGGSSNHRVFY